MVPPRYIINVLLYLLFGNPVISQTIDVTVHNIQSQGALLLSLAGEKSLPVDSIRGDGQGRFHYNVSSGLPHNGLYRLAFGRNVWVDFIIDGENVRLTTTSSNILDSMVVEESESNRLYFAFRRLTKQYKEKAELLHVILARYPKDDPYYQTTQTRLDQLQDEYTDFVARATSSNTGSFVARYIHSAQLPIVDGQLPLEQQLTFLKAHALDQVDFNDDGLTYSDLFTSKSIEYLTYYRNPQLPKELLEKEFMKAVDSLLSKARVNEIVYQHITEYLLEGFKNFGFEKCIDYILDNYVIKDDLCLDQSSGSAIQKMIDQKKLLTLGSTVPNIILPDSAGHPVDVSQLQADKILLVFYASSCPHCQTMIPELEKLYAGQQIKDVEVVGIALDTDRKSWLGFIRDNGLDWISISDLQGWSSPVAAKYHIYATPTLVVLDGEGRVVGVPTTVMEAEKYF